MSAAPDEGSSRPALDGGSAAPRAGWLRRRTRTPVVLQTNLADCSGACLAMILAHYGREESLAECTQRCGVGRDGATAHGLAQAARSYGLRVRAFSLAASDLSELPLPAVVHWNFDHFLVVERWSTKALDVIDPACGRRHMSRAEFDLGFTGIAMTFEPGPQFARARRSGALRWHGYLRQLLGATRLRSALLQVLLFSLSLQGIALALPVLTKLLVDHVLPQHIDRALPALAAGIVSWMAAYGVADYLRSRTLVYMRGKLDAQMMLGFFEHLLSLPFAFFQRRTSGDLLMRLNSHQVLRELLTSQTAAALLDVTLLVGYLALLLAWQPTFAVLALALGLAQVALALAAARSTRALMQQDLAAQAQSQSYLVEALQGIATLKASGAEDRALEHWSNLFFKQLNLALRRGRLAALYDSLLAALRLGAPLLLLWLGASEVLAGRLSLGSMLALNALAAAFLAPLSSLVTNAQSLQWIVVYFDRIADVLEAAPEQQGTGLSPDLARGELELVDVDFRHAPGATLALHGVSLRVRPGEKIALVGRTGSGKSTLGRVLLGLHEPERGRVTFDGRPPQDWNLKLLRQRFGVVLQDAQLFSGTIRSNICWGDPSPSLERAQACARMAAIADEIEALPLKYETPLSEGGQGLSGGQQQRLMLARALASNPLVLLLDEATSHLDALTEAEVQRALDGLRCTRIVIAHRLSTIRTADRIYVLEQGRIVEHGTHRELLARGGVYAELLAQQLAE